MEERGEGVSSREAEVGGILEAREGTRCFQQGLAEVGVVLEVRGEGVSIREAEAGECPGNEGIKCFLQVVTTDTIRELRRWPCASAGPVAAGRGKGQVGASEWEARS